MRHIIAHFLRQKTPSSLDLIGDTGKHHEVGEIHNRVVVWVAAGPRVGGGVSTYV